MDFDVAVTRLYDRYSVVVRALGEVGHGSDIDYADAFALAMQDWERKSGRNLEKSVTLNK